MVMDIRFLDPAEPEDTEPPEQQNARAGDDLEEMLDQAARAATAWEQARVVEQLRQIIPSAEGEEILWAILTAEDDSRRLVAAQMLGYHRQWLSSRSRLRQMTDLARGERDGPVARALVWGLRQRSEIGEFLTHPCQAVAREAALGLPLNRQILPLLLRALLAHSEPGAECERVLLGKLRSIHPSLVRDLVDLLLEQDGEMRAERLAALFECLPQLPLFEILLEERQLPDWNPQHDGQATRARIWQQLVRAARQTLERSPSFELVRFLLTRSGEDDEFARRHARFLHAAVQSTDATGGDDLIAHFERLTFRASEEKVARLAQLLVELSQRLEGDAEAQASSLLENWKNRSPDLRLKIYHFQNKLGE